MPALFQTAVSPRISCSVKEKSSEGVRGKGMPRTPRAFVTLNCELPILNEIFCLIGK